MEPHELLKVLEEHVRQRRSEALRDRDAVGSGYGRHHCGGRLAAYDEVLRLFATLRAACNPDPEMEGMAR